MNENTINLIATAIHGNQPVKVSELWDIFSQAHPEHSERLAELIAGDPLIEADLLLVPEPFRPHDLTQAKMLREVIEAFANGVGQDLDVEEIVLRLGETMPEFGDIFTALRSAVRGEGSAAFMKLVPVKYRLIASVALRQLRARDLTSEQRTISEEL